MEENMYVIENIDATIIAQCPKLAPYKETMKKNICEVLKLCENQVNIKATTEEGLGFTGSGEGMSAQAICSLNTIENYSYEVGEPGSCCTGCRGCKKEM